MASQIIQADFVKSYDVLNDSLNDPLNQKYTLWDEIPTVRYMHDF